MFTQSNLHLYNRDKWPWEGLENKKRIWKKGRQERFGLRKGRVRSEKALPGYRTNLGSVVADLMFYTHTSTKTFCTVLTKKIGTFIV